MIQRYFIIAILLFTTGCANQEYLHKNSKFLQLESNKFKQIMILPFDGEPSFKSEVSDLFTMQLLNGLKNKEIKVIQPL